MGCVNIVHIYYFLWSSGEGCVNIVHIYYFLWSSGEGVCKYSSYILYYSNNSHRVVVGDCRVIVGDGGKVG